MLTTAQQNSVRSWIVASIVACPELTPIPLERIVWENQDFPDLAYPYVTLGYTGTEGLNASPRGRVNDDDELEEREQHDTTLSITVVTRPSDTAPSPDQTATAYIRELRSRARGYAGDVLRQADLAIRDINVVFGIDRLQGGSQWESRAALDLTLGHALVVTSSPGVITQAEVTGTTSPPTPLTTVLIPS